MGERLGVADPGLDAEAGETGQCLGGRGVQQGFRARLPVPSVETGPVLVVPVVPGFLDVDSDRFRVGVSQERG